MKLHKDMREVTATMVSAVHFCIAYITVDVLCILLTFIVSSSISHDSGSEMQIRFFFSLLTAFLVFCVFDAVWAILVFSQQFNPSELMLAIVNGINLTAVAAEGYFWFCFSLAYFNSHVTNNRKARLVLALPIFLVIILHVIGYFTHQNVIFMPDGSVAYGVMHVTNTVIQLFYVIGAALVALRLFRLATTHSTRHLAFVFILFTLAPLAAGILDIVVPDMPFAAAGAMVSIIFVMMSLQETRVSNDALTGLNNRRRADTYLEERISRASAEYPVYFFLIDMDRFKSINDTYGHLEGDHALKIMANTLRSVCAQVNAFGARWGGDEFVLISAQGTNTDPEDIVLTIKETLAQKVAEAQVDYELACSTGYATCTSPQTSGAKLVAEADKALYAIKQASRR